MKIVILAIGTRGDVLPYAALGIALKKASYDVILATHNCFAGLISAYGLEFRPLSGEPDKWAEGTELSQLAGTGKSFRKWMLGLRSLAEPLIKDIFDSCWRACQGAGAIIYSPLAWAGYSIGEKLSVPAIAACLQPMSRTRYFPSVWSPAGARLGGFYNLFTHTFTEQLFWHANEQFINTWRTGTLGLPRIPYFGPFKEKRWREQLFLYAFSPALIPAPKDWPRNARITGFWFPPEDHSLQPEKNLVSFIEEGSPPVYIGFGSVPDDNPSELRDIVLTALQRTGLRAVVQGRRIFAGEMPRNILRVDWVSHDWLLSKCAAAVHHGGAGTLARSLRAGIPSVVVPYAWDQFFWGERVHNLGVGPKPISRRGLNANKLALAAEATMTNAKMKNLAYAFRRRLHDEHGTESAVEFIREYLGG